MPMHPPCPEVLKYVKDVINSREVSDFNWPEEACAWVSSLRPCAHSPLEAQIFHLVLKQSDQNSVSVHVEDVISQSFMFPSAIATPASKWKIKSGLQVFSRQLYDVALWNQPAWWVNHQLIKSYMSSRKNVK